MNRDLSSLISQVRWLVGDWHFGESRMDLMCRPFRSTEDHDETIIRNHNSVVEPDDVVLCVGDATNKAAPEALSKVERLHGRKILIRGNHDAPHSDDDLLHHFDAVIPDGDGLELVLEGISCYATHYPTCGRSDRFNIVGHVHGAWRFQLNMLNVGVDNFGFFPCAVERVPFFLDAVTNHYDEDVWAAYHPSNANFRENRGKKTSYFQPDAGS